MTACPVCARPCSHDAVTCRSCRAVQTSPLWQRIVECGGLRVVVERSQLHRWTVSEIATGGVTEETRALTLVRLAAALEWSIDELVAAGVADEADRPRAHALRSEDVGQLRLPLEER